MALGMVMDGVYMSGFFDLFLCEYKVLECLQCGSIEDKCIM